MGYDPATHQDKFYGAGSGGYYIYDVSDVADDGGRRTDPEELPVRDLPGAELRDDQLPEELPGLLVEAHDDAAVALVGAVARRARDQSALAHAGARPAADDAVAAAGQAGDRHLQRQRRDVLVLDRVRGRGVDPRGVGDDAERRVDQVEDRPEVDREALLALADEKVAA